MMENDMLRLDYHSVIFLQFGIFSIVMLIVTGKSQKNDRLLKQSKRLGFVIALYFFARFLETSLRDAPTLLFWVKTIHAITVFTVPGLLLPLFYAFPHYPEKKNAYLEHISLFVLFYAPILTMFYLLVPAEEMKQAVVFGSNIYSSLIFLVIVLLRFWHRNDRAGSNQTSFRPRSLSIIIFPFGLLSILYVIFPSVSYRIETNLWIIYFIAFFLFAVSSYLHYAKSRILLQPKFVMVTSMTITMIVTASTIYFGELAEIEIRAIKEQIATAGPNEAFMTSFSVENYRHAIFVPITYAIILINSVVLTLAAFLFRRILIAPLQDLLKDIEEVKAGDLNLRVAYGIQDEIGQFSIAFNEMLQSVEKNKDVIERSISTLETRVEERKVELQIAIGDIEKANRTKSVFIESMSQELKIPLNVISQATNRLQAANPDLKSIQTIQENYQHLDHLIGDILTYAEPDGHHPEPKIAQVDLRLLLMAVIDSVNFQISKKGLQFVYELSHLPLKIYSNPQSLRQILMNLFNNAVKFTQKGHIKFEVSASPFYDNSAKIYFAVTDTGIGIEKSEQEMIFEPFIRGSNVEMTTSGAGLGLAICKQLVDQLGGRLQFEDMVEGGSRFWFEVDVLTVPKVDSFDLFSDQVALVLDENEVQNPSAAHLSELRTAARIGDIFALEEILTRVVEEDEHLRPFFDEANSMISSYKMQEFRRWLDRKINSAESHLAKGKLDQSPVAEQVPIN